MKKLERTKKGYMNRRRIYEIIKTILFFAIPLLLFAAGIWTTGTKKNLLTIVAVLGLLPACKEAVLMIMYIKSHGISDKDYEQIEPYTDKLCICFDNVFTTYEKTYEVPAIAIKNNTVCGYIQNKKNLNVAQLEEHLTTTLKKDGINALVKIFDNESQFMQRLETLSESAGAQDAKDQAILNTLIAVSL